MAITYPLAQPTSIGIADITFTMTNARAMSQSPFTGRTQLYKWPLQQWDVRVTLPPMKRDLAEPWITFLAKLNAGVSTDFPSFHLSNPDATPLGSQPSNFIVNNGGDPNTLLLSNLVTGQTGVLAEGDYIRVGVGGAARYHKVLDRVDSDGTGNAEATIWPANYQPLSNAQGSLQDAYGTFILTDPSVSFNINNISSYGIEFTARSIV